MFKIQSIDIVTKKSEKGNDYSYLKVTFITPFGPYVYESNQNRGYLSNEAIMLINSSKKEG